MALISLPYLAIAAATLPFLLFLLDSLYNIFLHPLRRFPGPFWWRFSKLPFAYRIYNNTLPWAVLPLHQRYGPVVRIAPDKLAFATPDAWRDIYGPGLGNGGAKAELPKPRDFYAPVDGAVPETIALVDPYEHANLRRALATGFSERALRDMQDAFDRCADVMMAQLGRHSDGNVNLTAWFNYATLDIIGDLAFGRSFGCLELGDYVEEVRTAFLPVLPVSPLVALAQFGPVRRFANTILAFDSLQEWMKSKTQGHLKYTAQLLAPRMEMKDRVDLTEGLLKRHAQGEMSWADVVSNSSIIVLAGSETSATGMTATTFFLCTNPQYMAKATREIRTIFGHDSQITLDTVHRVPFFGACVEEALRVYPPGPGSLPRQTVKGGSVIAGQWIPEKTSVGVYQWASNHLSTNFVDPDAYRPERWLSVAEAESVGIDEGEVMRFAKDKRDMVQVFHVGPRSCIGRNLAYAQMRLFLARLLFNFDVELLDDSRDWDKRQTGFIVWDKHPLNVKLTPVAREA